MESIMSRKCKLCGVVRYFKTSAGYRMGENKLCRSCTNSITLGGVGFVRPIDGKRKCGKCYKILSEKEFVLYKNGRRHSYCNKCKSDHFKNYQKTIGRFKRHGITKEIYDDMIKNSKNRCNICKIKSEEFHIDHNHTTNEVRGILCRDCNLALGLIKENKKTLQNMIQYLENR